MFRKAACHPHKGKTFMLTKRRYHLVERCTLSIKEGQGPTLGVHQTTEHDAGRLIHWYLQTDCDEPNTIETIPMSYHQLQIDEKGVKVF